MRLTYIQRCKKLINIMMVARGKQDEEGYHEERNRNFKAIKLQSVLLQPVDQYLMKIALLFIQTRDFVLFSFNQF